MTAFLRPGVESGGPYRQSAERVPLKPRHLGPFIVSWEHMARRVAQRQQTLGERAVRQHADLLASAVRQDRRLNAPIEQVVRWLERLERVAIPRVLHLGGVEVRDPDETYLAPVHEVLKGVHGRFNR